MDKMLALPGHTFFVKIDEPYSYGEKEGVMRSLCKLAYSVPQFFVAQVPVQEFNDKDNDDVRQKFNLTKKDFPAFYLFNGNHPDGLTYDGPVQAANMIKFLRLQGVMMPSIDTIDELDVIVDRFLEAPGSSHVADARAVAERYTTDVKAPMYAKIMEKMLEKGSSYASSEISRVMKLLGGKVHPEKRAELSEKLKVLKVFAKQEACDMYKCPDGYKKKFDASGIIGADTETCCNPPCESTEGDEHDAQGHHCDYYDERTARECGDWDTGTFRANAMCCACGGGHRILR